MTELLIMAAYLALLLVLGVMSQRFFRGTAKDYFLASHSIGPVLLLMSIFGTTMIAVSLLTPAPSQKTLRKFFQPANKTALSGAGAAAAGD
jgi:Na+/proline symporter